MAPAVHRATNAKALNAILNDPSVKPYVSMFAGTIDATALVKDTNNVTIMAAGGGCLFHNIGRGQYVVHAQFVEGRRGKYALSVCRQAVAWLFKNTAALEILAFIPVTAPHSAVIARYCGFEYRGLHPNAWPIPGGPLDAGFFVLPRSRWSARHGH